MLRTFSIVASPPTHQPPSLKPNQKAMRSILMKGHSHSWNTTATATSCFPTPKITTLPSGSPTTASVSAPTVATTAPFGAAMSQASPLNPQTNSLFYLFFLFVTKKFWIILIWFQQGIRWFWLLGVPIKRPRYGMCRSESSCTRSKRVGSLNLIGLSFLISNADFAVWFLRKKIEKRSN